MTNEDLASAAWLAFDEDCKKVGMVASAYTAFKCGYYAGKFDYEEANKTNEQFHDPIENRPL